MLSALCLSGCSGVASQTYTTAGASGDIVPPTILDRSAGVQGQVPLGVALEHLRTLQVLSGENAWPVLDTITGDVHVAPGHRVRDLLWSIESMTGWVYEPDRQRFRGASATHSEDAPDSFGRPRSDVVSREPRPMVALGVRFRRIQGGVSNTVGQFGAAAGGLITHFEASIPEGVEAAWASGDERGYTEGIVSADNEAGPGGGVVQTTRRTVTSGVNVEAIVARLPGGKCRVDGTLEVSSFSGASLDRSRVSIPLQLDGDRDVWIPIYRFRSGDASLSIFARGLGLRGAIGASDVLVEVRVR